VTTSTTSKKIGRTVLARYGKRIKRRATKTHEERVTIMAADKAVCKKLGSELVDLIYAIADGVDVSDAGAVIELVTALGAAASDIKADPDAAIAYVLSGASEAFGDRKVG